MAQIKRGDPHGLFKIQVQLVGADGYSYGQAGSALAAGSTTHSYVIDHPLSFEMMSPDGTVIDFTGGDRWLGSYLYGITSLGSFAFTMSSIDADLIALATGTTADQTTNDEWTIYSENQLFDSRPQVSIMVTFRIQSREASTSGGAYYGNIIIPRCWLNPKGATMGFQTKGEYQLQFVPTSSSRMITGVAFGANQDFQDNTIAAYTIVTDNPLAMSVHKANTTSASIVLAYKPVSEAVGTATSTKNLVVVNGTAGVADSVTASTKTVAVGSTTSVASSDVIGVLYETAFVT